MRNASHMSLVLYPQSLSDVGTTYALVLLVRNLSHCEGQRLYGTRAHSSLIPEADL